MKLYEFKYKIDIKLVNNLSEYRFVNDKDDSSVEAYYSQGVELKWIGSFKSAVYSVYRDGELMPNKIKVSRVRESIIVDGLTPGFRYETYVEVL